MPVPTEEEINALTGEWLQGDFFVAEDLYFLHLANLACPLTEGARETATQRVEEGEPLEVEGVASSVLGFVVITQTCDLVRDCRARSYVELSPLVEVSDQVLKEVRLLRRPAFAYIPNAAGKNVVADLDRMMTAEKSLLVGVNRVAGCNTDAERRAFSDALARHRTRPALPNDFNKCMEPLKDHLKKVHKRTDPEGALINSIGEIRVTASPNWDGEKVSVFFWFILLPEVATPTTDNGIFLDQWLGLFGASDKYDLSAVVSRLEDMTALDYINSERLDLDQLSPN